MVNVFKTAAGKERVWQLYQQLINMWPAPLDEVDIPTKCRTTHCIIAGHKNNPPLLLFHGVGDNSAVMWILNIEELLKRFYCIAGVSNGAYITFNYTTNQPQRVNRVICFVGGMVTAPVKAMLQNANP